MTQDRPVPQNKTSIPSPGDRKAAACRLRLIPPLLLGLLAACGAGPDQAAGGRGGGQGFGAGAPVTVVAQRLQPQAFVDSYTALGTAQANESIEITVRSSSIVTRIDFREGQRVNAGQVLVELDTRQEAASLSLAEAQLKQAESQYRRSQALAATQVVSAADLDQLEANLAVARAQLRGAQARLDTLSVRAPFAGVVGLRKISLGDLVSPDTVITTLDDVSSIKLGFSIPEAFMDTVRTGMPISAVTTVYPGRPFAGEVTSIDSRVDPVTRSVAVIATLPNAGGALKPGMFMTVNLEKRREAVLLIAEESLVPREGRQYVFVIEDGKAAEREVLLGGRTPGFAEIRSGLEAGALVVTEGTQRLHDGTPVSVNPGT
ncbi:MAG: efflux RND transporter periplasmic adaptor subunit [Gammaproteobacteria bacterium]|nr:efflux RND transporter periplasmic adaptor subunit [Gammaproteobacteria bacterium]